MNTDSRCLRQVHGRHGRTRAWSDMPTGYKSPSPKPTGWIQNTVRQHGPWVRCLHAGDVHRTALSPSGAARRLVGREHRGWAYNAPSPSRVPRLLGHGALHGLRCAGQVSADVGCRTHGRTAPGASVHRRRGKVTDDTRNGRLANGLFLDKTKL